MNSLLVSAGQGLFMLV